MGIKAIQRLLRDRDIVVARTTLNLWRRKNTPALKPPIVLEIQGNRPVLTASRKAMLSWVERASRRHLFQRSRKNHETRERRKALVRKVEQAGGSS